MVIRIITLLLSFFLCFGCTRLEFGAIASEKGLFRYEFHRRQMGTLFRIVLYAPDSLLAQKASAVAFAIF